MFRLTSCLALLFIFGGANVRADWVKAYDASLGTLPEAQGWSLDNRGGNPAPTVIGNALHQNASATSSVQRWYADDESLDFEDTSEVVVEAELKIISSTYKEFASSGKWRTGYAISLMDRDLRFFHVGIASNGVRIANDWNWEDGNSSSFVPFDTTGAFNVYRFEVSSGMGQLFINDSPIVSLSVGAINSPPDLLGSVNFGDESLRGESQAELHYFRYVPEPSTLILLCMGAFGFLSHGGRRRR